MTRAATAFQFRVQRAPTSSTGATLVAPDGTSRVYLAKDHGGYPRRAIRQAMQDVPVKNADPRWTVLIHPGMVDVYQELDDGASVYTDLWYGNGKLIPFWSTSAMTIRAQDPNNKPVLRFRDGDASNSNTRSGLWSADRGMMLEQLNGPVTIENIVFDGGKVYHADPGSFTMLSLRTGDQNATVRGCHFMACGNTIGGDGAMTIENNEFYDCGLASTYATGESNSHAYYGDGRRVRFVGNWFHNAPRTLNGNWDSTDWSFSAGHWKVPVGHFIKFRMQSPNARLEVHGNLFDNRHGWTSRIIELPWGGDADIRGNLIIQGLSDASELISFHREVRIASTLGAAADARNTVVLNSTDGHLHLSDGTRWTDLGSSRLLAAQNTIVNESTRSMKFFERHRDTPVAETILDNVLVGPGAPTWPQNTVQATLAPELFIDRSLIDFRMRSPVDGGTSHASVEYRHPASTRPRTDARRGAFS